MKAVLSLRRESRSGSRKLALDIRTDCELKIEGWRRSHRSASVSGWALIERLWIANCRSVAASWKGQPGIVANLEGLIGLVGQCIKKEGVRSSRNGGVDNGEGDCTIVVNEDLEAIVHGQN